MIQFLLKYKIIASITYFFLQLIFFFSRSSFFIIEDNGLTKWVILILLAIFWLIVLVDMIKIKFLSKTFWIIFMVFIPYLAPVFYLFQRSKLLHLKNNKFRKFEK